MLKIKSVKVMEKMLADLWLPLIKEEKLHSVIELEDAILLAPGTSVEVTLETSKGPATLSASMSEGDINSVQMKYNMDDDAPLGTLMLVAEDVEWQE